jgi:hypothetical protein
MSRKTRRYSALAVGIGLLSVVACTDAPTIPQATDEDAVSFKKGGGGGGGNKDIAVTLDTFTLGHLGSENGALPAAIQKTGNRLWMRLPKKGKPPQNPPRLCVALPEPFWTSPDTTDWHDFKTDPATNGGTGGCYASVTLHTRDHRPVGEGLFTQEVDTTITAGGKIQLSEITAPGDWRLIFDTGADNPDTSQIGKGVCVDHPDVDTWKVYNGCEVDGVTVDDVIQLWRVTEVWTHVADFTMPFSFIVTRVQ